MNSRESLSNQTPSLSSSDRDRAPSRRFNLLRSSRASTSNVAPDNQRSHPGYETVVTEAPASNRPLWSLGTTLPRVRRINSRTPSATANTPPVQPPPPLDDVVLSDPPSSPPPVHAVDYAEAEGSGLNQITSRPSHEQIQTLPKIEEGTSLPTPADAKPSTGPNYDHTSTSPIRQPGEDFRDPQATLANARQQLLQEAQQSQNEDNVNESAVDAGPETQFTATPPHHIKTTSLPFLPSQGHSALERSASQNELESKSRQTGEAPEKSVLQKTRHPGLSGARPPPRGRAAGGPAVGAGTRRPSTQNSQATPAAPPDGSAAQTNDYFGQGSTHQDSISATGQRNADDRSMEHIEARPVGGRSHSHHSTARDTRNAWMKNNMPNQVEQDKDQQDESHSQLTAVSPSNGQSEQGAWLGGQNIAQDGTILFPTVLSKYRYRAREFLAEMLACILLLVVGTSVDCQVTLSQSMGSNAGSYTNQNWAWGLAVASTIYLSGGRSGAHCNPAITLGLAVYRGFPWKQVPIYWAAQLLGSFLGAAITYGIYLPALDNYEGGRHIRTLSGPHGTGRLFVTVPELVFTRASGFGTEVAATSILMAMILAVGDETNAPPSDGLSALILGLVVVMIGMSLGWPTSYAISPSRDLGPRIFLSMVGYGSDLWTHNSYWWLYGPICGCLAGALLGGLLYDLAIFTGEESPINYTSHGWAHSTPAHLTARLFNARDRLRFAYPKLSKSDQADTNNAISKLRSAPGAIHHRRPSPESHELGQQEQGLSHSASG